MPDLEPTREEMEAQKALDALADYMKAVGRNGVDRAFLAAHKEASERLARARHLRKAVEGLDDRDLWDAIEAGGFGDGNLHAFRATLLNILLNK